MGTSDDEGKKGEDGGWVGEDAMQGMFGKSHQPLCPGGVGGRPSC